MGDHLTLFQLNQLVRQTLDANLAPSYWVIAEIGGMNTNQKGHCYLELVEKEDNKVIAKSRATIWAYTFRNLSTWFEGMTGKPLLPGLKILCNVAVEYHELYGFSLNIKDIDASFTLGERARKRKETIDQLVADGVFDMNKNLRLPMVPQSVAVISSPTAAGYGDFINQLEHSGYHFNLQLFTATVQGEQAAGSIISALHRIHHKVGSFDAVCIIRGGGSQVDLDCFDHYELTAHIAQFPLPILTGIGHERDETISDLVAHTRLKTPTAVAEFLINGMRIFEEQLESHFSNLYTVATHLLQREAQQLENLNYRVNTSAKEQLRLCNFRIDHLNEKLLSTAQSMLKSQTQKLMSLEKHLELINPLTLLERGYTITLKDGKRIGNQKILKGDEIETITRQQTIKSTVKETISNHE